MEREDQLNASTNNPQSDLPEVCYAVVGEQPGRRIGIINRGDMGFYPCDLDHAGDSPEEVDRRVERLNLRLGVTVAQASRMLAGSMFGWNTPGARMSPEEFRATRPADEGTPA